MMRRLIRALTGAALLIGLLLTPVATVQACSCVALPLEEQLAAAELAVVGTVASAVQVGVFPGENIRHTLQVEFASRPVPAVLQFDTNPNDGSCGTGQYQIGLNGLFVLRQVEGRLGTMLCDGNRSISDMSRRELALLEQTLQFRPGQGAAGLDLNPPQEAGEAAADAFPHPLQWAAFVLVAAVLAAAGVWGFRGTNRPRRS